MSDLALLELAAKAARTAGINIGQWHEAKQAYHVDDESNGGEYWWCPLEDDGDALRLSSVLRLQIEYFGGEVAVSQWMQHGEGLIH
ncbi:hypothetical protein [Pseudomonas fluorescens]|uniref:hypothetical protein n=1 Tax=Pseudomonas fluorescens TaxID=294 RepID=UPI003D1E4D2B